MKENLYLKIKELEEEIEKLAEDTPINIDLLEIAMEIRGSYIRMIKRLLHKSQFFREQLKRLLEDVDF